MKVLRLTLKKKWFDMIASGEKKEEYREFKEYWIKRFGYFYESANDGTGYWNEEMTNLPDAIEFVNGYRKDSDRFLIEVVDWGMKKSVHPEWGGDTVQPQFIFYLGEKL